MRRIAATLISLALAATLGLAGARTAQAQDNVWRIAKVTGQAWLGGDGVATVALSQQSELKPGDSIRTGRNGRVLLMRGAESMMISANSAISLPEAGRPGMTTVIQQAGSILLDVEKRNVQHFEVETPYLAAVVKGTRFTVTVANGRAQVNVARGQVQVADFRSGQFALVLPGQIARVAQRGVGLQLSGSGALGAIQQGPAQAPRVTPLPVPQQGFTAAPARSEAAPAQPVLQEARAPRDGGIVRGPGGAMRITAPVGEIKLDINKVTRGLARSEAGIVAGQGRKSTIWNNNGNGSARSDTARNGNSSGVDAPDGRVTGSASSALSNPGNSAGNPLASIIRSSNSNSAGGQIANSNGGGNGNAGGTGAGISSSGSNSNGNAGGNGNGNAGGNGNGNSGGNGLLNGVGNSVAAARAAAQGLANGNAFGLLKGNNGNGNGNAFGHSKNGKQ